MAVVSVVPAAQKGARHRMACKSGLFNRKRSAILSKEVRNLAPPYLVGHKSSQEHQTSVMISQLFNKQVLSETYDSTTWGISNKLDMCGLLSVEGMKKNSSES